MHPKLAHNNLAYTGATRAQSFLCIIAEYQSLMNMIKNVLPLNRNSNLINLLPSPRKEVSN
jgi:ATP-dependent exoDNAse (exonuclease V) alpha subunit